MTSFAFCAASSCSRPRAAHWTERPDGSIWAVIKAFERGLPETMPMDVISALEVLEHITDTDRFMSEVYERLRPGGWFLLSTPNINSLRNRVTVPFGAYPTGLEYRNIIHHVRLYNPHVLAAHLASKGFSEIRMRGVSFLPMRFLALGRSGLSRSLADLLPQLCNNFLVVARRATSPGSPKISEARRPA